MDISLILQTNDGRRKNFALPSTVTVIGRRQDCDLCIPLMNVSRRHCEINQDEGKLKLRDLGSRNGTFVNGEKISEAELKEGDLINIGPLQFTIAMTEKASEKAEKLSTQFLKDQGHYTNGSNETEIMEGFSQ